MPVVQIREGCEHRTERGLLGAGEAFYASEAELASFGDKFEMVTQLGRGSAVDAAYFPPVKAEDVQAAIEEAEAGQGKVGQAGDEAEAGATPQAQELAAEYGVDLGRLTGSGQDGRILKKDVAAYLEEIGDA